MAMYKTFTTVGDSGPFVSMLILDVGAPVRDVDLDPALFSVYVERKDPATGEVVLAKEHRADPVALPSRGFVPVRRAFACDENGRPQDGGTHVALKLPEIRLTKRIDGDILAGHLRQLDYRVMQTRALPPEKPGEAPVVGLVFDECEGDVCPQLAGWDVSLSGIFDGVEMAYALYTPDVAAVNARLANPGPFGDPKPALDKVPLVVWLHGAGEGGGEPYRTITGNKVVALGEPEIQEKLGGAAYVLAPSCPTFWMDSGSGEITDDNRSIYGPALLELIDEVTLAHPEIDVHRIYIGGLSNGGFMTCRMVVDYPETFAAAVACCAPWVGALASDEEMASMATTPIWFIQVDDDPLVPPESHLKSFWDRLLAAGAADAHATYYDTIADETGVYRDEDGRPVRYIGHLVWINVYHDTVKTELDGTNVLWDGFPVTLWQWVGAHQR